MAYVSHSSYHAYGRSRDWSRFDASLLGRAAIVALAAGAAVVALSGAAMEEGGAKEQRVLGKGDRIVAASVMIPAASKTYVVDGPSRTTTVEKGSVAGLSQDSPYAAAFK
ncbi:hypothetical protein ACFQI3_03420 [Hansschlegelia quercus]|uniref:Uncharacterized protein n=1 Tax=Hansschlegelia quercus TaxID=2528245 RepID=A0A4Q9GL55_9HYPH|nr:hypothetical protein [Hansschlegelia quercus]TBN54952.1 hypothetical protein EYR15_02025 [Hansschlegelia quercus]